MADLVSEAALVQTCLQEQAGQGGKNNAGNNPGLLGMESVSMVGWMADYADTSMELTIFMQSGRKCPWPNRA